MIYNKTYWHLFRRNEFLNIKRRGNVITPTDLLGTHGLSTKTEAESLYLAHDLETTGIQEKYLKSQLTAQEPLSELDIKRFIVHTGMGDHIHITQLHNRDIGTILHYEREKHTHSTEPYSISMMINAGSEGEPAYSRWLSLIVTVNPLSGSITYKVNAGYTLNEEQKDEIAKTISGAIQFEEPDKAYSAFPHATSISNEIKGQDAGKLCGYKALHELYKDEALQSLLEENESAISFQTKKDIYAIKQAVYDVQLKAIRLSPAQRSILTSHITANFSSLGIIKPDALEQQLGLLETPTVDATTGQHHLVAEQISELQIYHNKIRFPGQLPSPPLTSNDYNQFLLLTNEKFRSSGTNKIPNEMIISCYDSAGLEGLIAYNETHQPLPFHTLTLDLAALDLRDQNAQKCFLFHLKTTLLTMSETNLSCLTIMDNNHQLTAEMINELAQFIKERKIAIDINLPIGYQDSRHQKEIDDAVADNMMRRNIAALRRDSSEQGVSSKRASSDVRKRPKLSSKQGLSVDVELQQEQQVEVAVEASTATSTGAGEIKPANNTVLYSMERFANALARGDLDRRSKSYLIGSSREKAIALWRNWTGSLSDIAAADTKISKSACEELLRYQDKFQYGLDLQNLPPGFLIKKDPAMHATIIHFDENIKQISAYNPLQIQTTELPEEQPLSTTLFNKWLSSAAEENPIKSAWIKLNTAKYNKTSHQLFKTFLPKMLLLKEEELAQLYTLCFKETNQLDNEKFQFLMGNALKLKVLLDAAPDDPNIQHTLQNLFKDKKASAITFIHNYDEKKEERSHHLLKKLIAGNPTAIEIVTSLEQSIPNISLNALLQLYVQLGDTGLAELSNLVNENPTLFQQLNTPVFTSYTSYTPLLSEPYKNAIKAISAFSAEEKVWWDTLLKQHCETQANVNLVDLVNAFNEFKKELKTLSTLDGIPLQFPPICELKGVKSLPVALSRILSLLKHSNEANRTAQWGEVSKLDLSSTGMIKPISTIGPKQWAFITQEMKINAQDRVEGEDVNQYDAPTQWSTVFWEGTSPEKLHKSFFRYAAYQENNGQLPLEFYQHVHKKMIASDLSEHVQRRLYTIIAASTTKPSNVATIKSLDQAIIEVDQLINCIINPSIPDIIGLPILQLPALKENVRVNMLAFFIRLHEIPPLPIVIKLYSMISNSLNSLSKIITNQSRLEKAGTDFNLQIETYGARYYEGMKDYTDEDYKDSDIFFSHLALTTKIDLKIGKDHPVEAQNLIAIISSFRIKLDDLDLIIAAQFNNPSESAKDIARRNEALDTLRKLSTQDHPSLRALSTADLMSILATIKASDHPVVEILKNIHLPNGPLLAAYFPEDYLENYGKAGIPELVEASIMEQFTTEQQRAQVRSILLRFSAPGDSIQYNKVVQKIVAISKQMNEIEKKVFISKLATSLGLYTNIQRLDQENNDFIKLLDALVANKSANELLSLLAAERNLLRSCSPTQTDEFFVSLGEDKKVAPTLSKKAAFYLNTLLPNIRTIENLALSQIDLIPRLQETLLKTPTSELGAVSNVVSEKFTIYNHQESALAAILERIDTQNSLDFTDIDEATEAFIAHSSPDDHASSKIYSARIKKIRATNVAPQDIEKVALNPAMITLFTYFKEPGSLPPSQKTTIDTIVQRYPSLMTNKDLIQSLRLTPKLWQSLAKRDVLDAAQSIDLIGNPAKLELVFSSLASDLDSFNELKKQTIQLKDEITTKKAALNSYPQVFIALYKSINDIAIANPNSKKQFLELYDRYLQHYSPVKHGQLLKYLSDFVNTLEKSFKKTTAPNNVLSLCLQFNSDTDKELQPEGLMRLLNVVEKVPEEHQAIVLKIAVALINNEKDYTLASFTTFCERVKARPEFAEKLASMYEKPPFPTIKQVMAWHVKAVAEASNTMAIYDVTYATSMDRLYTAFNKSPCHRELTINGFHEDKAKEQLAKFTGFEAGQIDLLGFEAKTIEMHTKTSAELLAIFDKFNPKKPQYDAAMASDTDTLIAVAAELFHRSKGKDKTQPDGSFAMGSSMEINTTQYLAILSSLKTPGHVTSQIGTGEGKSRIMMISIACQQAQGKTVDFVTSDAQLATRDFVEYQAYFDMIGAKTSMIFAHTDPSVYQQGGVNFSDPSNLSLFRNKARSTGRSTEVLDPDPTNRALLLDEADKTYFDVADTRFNFSMEGDENIRGMSWVYPLLMQYFAKESVSLTTPIHEKTTISPTELFYEDIDLSREKFLQFATSECSKEQLLRLKALSNAQIEQWQVSAVTASELKFKEDFVIEPDMLISTSSGPKISSEAQLLFANRVSRNSKFSFGVHQCLHARLNLARMRLDIAKDPILREALSVCEQPFHIPDEKQIVYSSTSKNLLDDYHAGTLKAVTGTSGSIIERKEAEELYGVETDKMHFIDVPTDKGIHRTDRALRLTRNQTQQFNALVAQIKEARKKHQPILVIAENDEESELLFKKINELFKDDKIQHIHSQLSLKDEKDRIDRAGAPGQITVSTDMIGRGTDISVKGEGKKYGLNVMITYLPKSRDLAQIIGRSGRFGAKGETSLVLDKHRLRKILGKTKLSDAFYSNVETYIRHEQALMDRRSQCERLIKSTVGDFRKKLTDSFFETMLKSIAEVNYKKLLPSWTTFFDKSDKEWNAQWPHIQKELATYPMDPAKIEALLGDYRDKVQKRWEMARRHVQDVDITCIDGIKPVEKLIEEVPPLVLTKTTTFLLTKPLLETDDDKEEVYDHFDPGHEGRAVKYTRRSVPLVATLKGYANLLGADFSEARRPLANFRAWLEGHGEIFPEFRARKYKATHAKQMALEIVDRTSDALPIVSATTDIYTQEKFQLAKVRLKQEGILSDKSLLSDAQWSSVINRLQTVLDNYKAKRNFSSKSPDKKREVQQLDGILISLKELVIKSHRSELLQEKIIELESIEKKLKDGLFKRSGLKQTLKDTTAFFKETITKADIGIDPDDLAQAIVRDENARLGAWSQYPALHDLKAAWWESSPLETIKKLTPTSYTTSAVAFFNTIDPGSLDSAVLKTLQTDLVSFDPPPSLEALRARGEALLRLDERNMTDPSIISHASTMPMMSVDTLEEQPTPGAVGRIADPGQMPQPAAESPVTPQPVTETVRNEIRKIQREYSEHVAKQFSFGYKRVGFFKNEIIQSNLSKALEETDLEAIIKIIATAKSLIVTKYGSQSRCSWFMLAHTTSKSIELLDNLTKYIEESKNPGSSYQINRDDPI